VTPYLQVAVRVRDLLAAAVEATGEAAVAGRRVPACPDWNVQQVLSHLGGVADDVLSGNLADAGRPHWTEAQVQGRRDRSLTDLAERWVEAATLIGDAAAGPAGAQMTMDACTHELDLRRALEAPPADVDLTEPLGWLLARFDAVLRRRGLPALQVTAVDPPTPRTWLLPGTTGDGATPAAAAEPSYAATFDGSRVDLLRSLTGRRCRAQVLALLTTTTDDVSPDDWLRAFTWGPFAPPALEVEPGPDGH